MCLRLSTRLCIFCTRPCTRPCILYTCLCTRLSGDVVVLALGGGERIVRGRGEEAGRGEGGGRSARVRYLSTTHPPTHPTSLRPPTRPPIYLASLICAQHMLGAPLLAFRLSSLLVRALSGVLLRIQVHGGGAGPGGLGLGGWGWGWGWSMGPALRTA